MWNQSFNDQTYESKAGGGFVNSQSPAIGGTQEKKKRSQNVVPLAIRQILDNSEENLTVCGHEVHMVSILGIVNKVDQVTTKVSYTIQDSTGEIQAVKWLEGDGTDTANTIMENTYVTVVGTARTQQGKKHVMVFKIQPLYDINQLTTHILEVIKTPYVLEEINKLQNGPVGGDANNQSMNTSVAGGAGGGAEPMDQSMGGGGGGGASAGGVEASLNEEQKMVYRIIKCTKTDEGADKLDLMQNLRGKMSTKAVEAAVEFLSGEGHIYSTVDDDHYKTTDDN